MVRALDLFLYDSVFCCLCSLTGWRLSGCTAMPTLLLSEEEGRPWGSQGSAQPGSPVFSSTGHCSGGLAVGSGSPRSPVLPALSARQPRTLKRLKEWIWGGFSHPTTAVLGCCWVLRNPLHFIKVWCHWL